MHAHPTRTADVAPSVSSRKRRKSRKRLRNARYLRGLQNCCPEWLVMHAVLRQDPCYLCGERPPEGWGHTLDHITPRSAGAAGFDPDNLAGCCRRCNRVKDSANLLEFLLDRLGNGA